MSNAARALPPEPDELLLYRTLAVKAPIPVLLTDLSTSHVIFTNDATDQVFGGGENMEGEAALDFYEHPEDRTALLMKIREQGYVHEYPLRVRRFDGSVGDFVASMVPIPISGRPVLYTYLMDVSEQRKAERRLARSHQEMSRILSKVEQGLFTLDRSAQITGARSVSTDALLGVPSENTRLPEWLSDQDPAFSVALELGWENLCDGWLPLELALEQLPKRAQVRGRSLEFAWQPIGGEDWERMLVVVTDVTDAEQARAAKALQEEVLALVDHVLSDRSGVLDFLDEAERLSAAIQAPPDLPTLRRDLHTLKGSAGLMGCGVLAHHLHELESFIDASGEAPSAQELSDALTHLERLSERVQPLVNSSQRRLQVSPADVQALRAQLQSGASADTLLALLDTWEHEPLRSRLERMGRQAQSLAHRLGKGRLKLQTQGDSLRVDPARLGRFWSAWSHAIRNAVDHGVELPEERGDKGPPTLELGVAREPGALRIWVRDDGAGVDWERVRTKAQAHGLPAETPEELEALLLSDGFSTREEITHTSGRGVGMAALRAAVHELGGVLHLESERGVGTTLSATLPWP